jgi:hypothetical protein
LDFIGSSNQKDVRKLSVMGDSKLVIKWVKQKANVQDVRLAPLLRHINLSYQSFEWLSFNHTLWELNGKVDEISKEPFRYYEFVVGEEK